jgi:fumarylacetoacetate (FAA) hydrolase
MRLGTIEPVTSGAAETVARDGQLVVISKDGTHYAPVPVDLAPSFREALEEWEATVPKLRAVASALERGSWPGTRPVEICTFRAPLPRAWGFLDGSAYLEHVRLARKARGAEPPSDVEQVPLMYQGLSDRFLGPHDRIFVANEEQGLDFEAEVAVITGDVPQGTKAAVAEQYIRCVLLLNDFTLRNLVPPELGRGFGFLQSKPPSSCGPFALTLDELGGAWRDGRLHMRMVSLLNGSLFGEPSTSEMHFSFHELIAHAARTRPLSAGTIIGSGTVANTDRGRGHSCIAEKRAVEQIVTGAPVTPYLVAGDRVEIFLSSAASGIDLSERPFGTIMHSVSSLSNS